MGWGESVGAGKVALTLGACIEFNPSFVLFGAYRLSAALFLSFVAEFRCINFDNFW